MKFYTIAPPQALTRFVRAYWVLESSAPSYTHREMADVCPELIFHYRGRFNELIPDGRKERSFISGIHGPSKGISRFHIGEPFGIFGVYLYPYALPWLFGIPAPEFTDRLVDLQSLPGQAGRDLEDRIMTAVDNRERASIMTRYLMSLLNGSTEPADPVLSSVRHLIRSNHSASLDEIAGRSYLSIRQFERKFKAATGLSPKLFYRISRFQSVIREFRTGTSATLTEIAHRCGYYDQSHFIRDFKSFSGHTPKQFFSGEAEAGAWLES